MNFGCKYWLEGNLCFLHSTEAKMEGGTDASSTEVDVKLPSKVDGKVIFFSFQAILECYSKCYTHEL